MATAVRQRDDHVTHQGPAMLNTAVTICTQYHIALCVSIKKICKT
jgi:hypothetical protein